MCRFTSYDWQEFLEQPNLASRISRRGICWTPAIGGAIGSSPTASAVVESLFNLQKRERIL